MKIAFIADGFEMGSPAQQLRDRFKIGFARDGVFQGSTHQIVDRVGDADGVIMTKNEGLESLQNIPVFLYGSAPAEVFDSPRPIFCGTEISTALRLPALKAGRAREALIVVQGVNAEVTGLNGLIPLLKNPKPVKRVRKMDGEAVWAAAEKKEWSWGLLRASLSRSDSPQGNAIVDGRVEDMSLQARTLAKSPRALLIEHEDGMRTTVLVLEGVVADVVLAIDDGRIHSTQLFRAPSPMREDFSRLAVAIEDFFRTKKAPISREGMRVVAAALREANSGG